MKLQYVLEMPKIVQVPVTKDGGGAVQGYAAVKLFSERSPLEVGASMAPAEVHEFAHRLVQKAASLLERYFVHRDYALDAKSKRMAYVVPGPVWGAYASKFQYVVYVPVVCEVEFRHRRARIEYTCMWHVDGMDMDVLLLCTPDPWNERGICLEFELGGRLPTLNINSLRRYVLNRTMSSYFVRSVYVDGARVVVRVLDFEGPYEDDVHVRVRLESESGEDAVRLHLTTEARPAQRLLDLCDVLRRFASFVVLTPRSVAFASVRDGVESPLRTLLPPQTTTTASLASALTLSSAIAVS
jgi:hypothetical protein